MNPLQVRPSPKDEEEEKIKLYEDEGYGLNDPALHMKNLDIFFGLYISTLTDMQKAVLKKCLITLYKLFGITWETDIHSIEADDFPVIKDWYDLILSKVKAEEKGQLCSDLAMLLYDMAKRTQYFHILISLKKPGHRFSRPEKTILFLMPVVVCIQPATD